MSSSPILRSKWADVGRSASTASFPRPKGKTAASQPKRLDRSLPLRPLPRRQLLTFASQVAEAYYAVHEEEQARQASGQRCSEEERDDGWNGDRPGKSTVRASTDLCAGSQGKATKAQPGVYGTFRGNAPSLTIINVLACVC